MLLFREPGGWESPPEAGWLGVCPGVGQGVLQAGGAKGSVGLQDWKLLFTSREEVTLNDPSFYTFQNHPRDQGSNSRPGGYRMLALPKGLPPVQEGLLLPARLLRPPRWSATGFQWVAQLPEGAVLLMSRPGWHRRQESSGRNRKI